MPTLPINTIFTLVGSVDKEDTVNFRALQVAKEKLKKTAFNIILVSDKIPLLSKSWANLVMLPGLSFSCCENFLPVADVLWYDRNSLPLLLKASVINWPSISHDHTIKHRLLTLLTRVRC